MYKISMKKISILVSIAFFAILFVVIVILLNFSNIVKVRNADDKPYRVALLLDGIRSDRSWGQSHYDALARVTGDLGIELLCRENVSSDETFDKVVTALIEDEGCSVIVAASFFYGERLPELTAKYPKVYFLHASGLDSGDNLCSFYGRMYQYRYLCGIITGTQTKTGKIGYVASYPTSEVNRGLNAFALGVRSVSPDAQVFTAFSGSWKDSERDRATAEKLINEYGVDVLSQHTDTLAPLETAKEHGILAAGCHFDNSDIIGESYLTGCVWQWDVFYREQILACMQSRFHGGHRWLDSESGIMSIVDPTKTDPTRTGYEEQLKAAQDKLASRSFDVFYGPVNDNNGELRIAVGESMSDESMLNKFDWYAEGVVIVE
ncbi:MAG: BMP family ABC transporter substrate-binding protein [Ruminiclostridium sp.]|nr:BMP family ABC transporter substrate-binding protein [Ruminiclostridium sp.]